MSAFEIIFSLLFVVVFVCFICTWVDMSEKADQGTFNYLDSRLSLLNNKVRAIVEYDNMKFKERSNTIFLVDKEE